MSALLDIIRTRLIAAGAANTSTWKCYIGFCPDAAEQLMSLHLSGGYPQETMEDDYSIETFQLRVRSGVYTTCEAKWQACYSALHGQEDAIGNSIRLIQAMASGPLEYYDDLKRVNMTMNLRVIRDRA